MLRRAPGRTHSGPLSLSTLRATVRSAARLTQPRRVITLVSSLCTLLTVARVVVLFVESWSAVASEREADAELMQMCDVGTAAQSADFRALCVRKRADRASPVLLKALLRACSTAFADFCELFSSWTKVALLVLFALTGIAAPIVKALAALFTAHLRKSRRSRRSTDAMRYGQRLQLGHVAPDSDDDEDEGEDADGGLLTTIRLDVDDDEYTGSGWSRPSLHALAAMGKLLRRRRAARRASAALSARVEEGDDYDDYGYPSRIKEQ